MKIKKRNKEIKGILNQEKMIIILFWLLQVINFFGDKEKEKFTNLIIKPVFCLFIIYLI